MGAMATQITSLTIVCSFWRRSKKISKLRVSGLCGGHLPVTGEFPAQMASNAEMFPFDDVIMVPVPVVQSKITLLQTTP